MSLLMEMGMGMRRVPGQTETKYGKLLIKFEFIYNKRSSWQQTDSRLF